jgi:tRNA G18 (ribose-2'-O)-methylase SpoU
MDCILFVCGVSCGNLGLILRSADIFGVNAIYFQAKNSINEKQILKLSRNSKVPVIFVNGTGILHELKEQGYQIAALEITDVSIPLSHATFAKKICIVVGNEQNGVPDEILKCTDNAFHIEMIGKHISSLNVSVATSIALYGVTQYFLNKT